MSKNVSGTYIYFFKYFLFQFPVPKHGTQNMKEKEKKKKTMFPGAKFEIDLHPRNPPTRFAFNFFLTTFWHLSRFHGEIKKWGHGKVSRDVRKYF